MTRYSLDIPKIVYTNAARSGRQPYGYRTDDHARLLADKCNGEGRHGVYIRADTGPMEVSTASQSIRAPSPPSRRYIT